jgi:CysZ protein
MKKLLTGFSAYFTGIKNGLTHGDLLRLTVIPFFLDCACLLATLYYTYSHLSDIVTYVLHRPETWYQYFLYYALYLVTGIGLLFLSILVAMIFANLISFPFNDMLAEKSLLKERALVLSERTFKMRMKKSFRNFSAMLKKTVLLLIFAALLALLGLIPGLAILGVVFSVFILAWDRLDYSFDQYEFTLGQRIDFIRKYFSEVLGFSAGLGLVMAIPIVNILLLPASVVAGAHLVASLRKITQE